MPRIPCSTVRYALDFHQLVNGAAHAGDSGRLEDFHCFGATVTSPAYGWVVDCRDDLPDNPPGEVDTAHCWGNIILIGLATGEHVLLAHLQQGSVTVAPGALLVPAQPIARCGNSGRSPQPHLHLHVQTAPWLGSPTRPFHLSFVQVGAHLTLDTVPAEHDRVVAPRLHPILAKALHRSVGRRYVFGLEGASSGMLDLDVHLDLDGRVWLQAASGARIAVVESDILVALHDRTGPTDRALDAMALATGLTPLVDDEASWTDSPPLRLLPTPWWLTALDWLLPGLFAVESRYHRRWIGCTASWDQEGVHRIRLLRKVVWSCTSSATLSETDGLTGFTVESGGHRGLRADLVRHGLRADNGIAGWEYQVGE